MGSHWLITLPYTAEHKETNLGSLLKAPWPKPIVDGLLYTLPWVFTAWLVQSLSQSHFTLSFHGLFGPEFVSKSLHSEHSRPVWSWVGLKVTSTWVCTACLVPSLSQGHFTLSIHSLFGPEFVSKSIHPGYSRPVRSRVCLEVISPSPWVLTFRPVVSQCWINLIFL